MWQHVSAYLGGRGVDAYKIVKVGLLGAQLDHPAITLGNLSCIGTQVVETNHLFLQRKRISRFKQKLLKSKICPDIGLTYLLRLCTDQLGIAGVLGPMSDCPLQRPKVGVIHLPVVDKNCDSPGNGEMLIKIVIHLAVVKC